MKKDYTRYSFKITALVIVLMLGVSLIPAFTIGGVRFKRTNIFSDLYKFSDEKSFEGEAKINPDEKDFLADMERFIAESEASAQPADHGDEAPSSETWVLGDAASSPGEDASILAAGPTTPEEFAGVTVIEDFTAGEGRPTVADFCALLGTASRNRVVRLGFLGDSYIEGDIITADVRSQMQERYGGGGVGFVPFSTPLAQNRPTVKHTFGGWQSHNLIKKKSAPGSVQERFFVSGTVSTPSASKSWSRYENTNFRSRLSPVSAVRLLFTNTGGAGITMTVNDTVSRSFTPPVDQQPQVIEIAGSGISRVRVDITDGEGFFGYGVYLEQGAGIGVDNFSVRSNSGLALFGTDQTVNSRVNRMMGYDMIVLQYGLNAMDPNVTRYTNYGQQLRRVINYIKGCFPRSVIVVWAVGDRSTQENGQFVTMPAVRGMVAEQRAAAQECGVAFWNTFEAMGGNGSMARFVERGWAAKDYTHLSFGGGRKIAGEFVKALEYVKHISAGGASVEMPGAEGGMRVSLDSFEGETGAVGSDTIPAGTETAQGDSTEAVTGGQAGERPEDNAAGGEGGIPAARETGDSVAGGAPAEANDTEGLPTGGGEAVSAQPTPDSSARERDTPAGQTQAEQAPARQSERQESQPAENRETEEKESEAAEDEEPKEDGYFEYVPQKRKGRGR